MNKIDFKDIRTHKGSQHEGFEELCCQLASFEEVPKDSIFRRKSGAGGDAGVECYWLLPNGNEKTWQTKYFPDKLGDSQWVQIDKSVKAALDKHPNLIEYIVCLPINRTEGRKDGEKSQMDRWDERVQTWEGWAEERDMKVQFVYWGESEIIERLSRPQPQYAGRAYFWFNKQELTNEWMIQRFQEVRENAGARYTPEIHVDLPEAQIFEGLGRTDLFFDRIDNLYSQLCRKWKDAKPSEDLQDKVPNVANSLNDLSKDVNLLITALKKASDRQALSPIDFDSIAGLSKKVWLYDSYTQIRQVNPSHNGQPKERIENREIDNRSNEDLLKSVRDKISKIEEIGGEIYHFATNDITAACNQGALLLTGEAGTGKTHLFCDMAKHRLDNSLPTIILLGQHFCQGDPWIQIMQRLHLSCHNRDEFLGALDAAAQACGSHAMILIDALNESDDKGLWKKDLAGMLAVLHNYPRITIAVSCRTSYKKATIPQNLVPEKLVKVEHHGFANHEYIATKTFFNHYGIEQPNVPLLVPEFSNPLFLKTLCKGIKNRKLTRIPKGIKGITAVLNLFIDSINDVLCERIDYDYQDNLVRQSVQSLACKMAEKEQPWIERKEAKNIVNSCLPNREFSQTLFYNLLAEGLLSEDLIYCPSEDEYEEQNQRVDIIKFPYEKFSDHLIVRYLLKNYLDQDNPTTSFNENKPLGRLVAARWNTQSISGLLEALLIQIPELLGKEVMELTSIPLWWFERQFLQSLIWRNPTKITQKTKDYIDEIFQEEGNEKKVYNVLLTVATDPEHPLNAKSLHRHLINLRMPERDAIWSIYLFDQYEQKGAVDRLLEWAWEAEKDHISDESIELCAIALTWFLTTSHRFLRDRATKALVSMLHQRPQVLVKVIEQFLEVDDIYVLERLYAVAYGVAMVSNDAEKIGELANKIYEWVFKEGTPPVHILLRDYARGVIEVAKHLGTLSDKVDIDKTHPPYKSDWNLDLQTEEELKLYIELIKLDFDMNLPLLLLLLLFKSWDSNSLIICKLRSVSKETQFNSFKYDPKWSLDVLYTSVMDYFRGGDFSQYVIEYRTRYWSSCILGEPKEPTKKERYEQFIDSLTTTQKQAWEEYQTISENVDLYNNLEPESRIKYFEEEFTDEELKEDIISGKASFYEIIDREKTEFFEKYVVPYLENPREDECRFDTSIAKRWIVKRVLELGWTIEKFGWFDGRCGSHGRAADKPERIGKKYQWIALHEFLGCMADHLEFRVSSGLDEASESSVYEGTWQIGIRDIDPSFLLKQIPESQQNNQKTWLKPIDYIFDEVDKQGQIDWIKQQDDCPDPCQLIELTNPNDQTVWLTLESHYGWEEKEPLEAEKYESSQRQMWYQIRSYIVRCENMEETYQWLKTKNFEGRWMPESGEIYDIFIGEFSWGLPYHTWKADNYWDSHTNSTDGDLPYPVVVTTTGYSFSSSFDCSTDETISALIPSAWLMKNMELRWSGEYFKFRNSNNEVVAFNPLNELSPANFFISKNKLVNFLTENNLDIIWTVLGERQLIGGNHNEWHGRLELSGVYRLKNGVIDGEKLNTWHRKPDSK